MMMNHKTKHGIVKGGLHKWYLQSLRRSPGVKDPGERRLTIANRILKRAARLDYWFSAEYVHSFHFGGDNRPPSWSDVILWVSAFINFSRHFQVLQVPNRVYGILLSFRITLVCYPALIQTNSMNIRRIDVGENKFHNPHRVLNRLFNQQSQLLNWLPLKFRK